MRIDMHIAKSVFAGRLLVVAAAILLQSLLTAPAASAAPAPPDWNGPSSVPNAPWVQIERGTAPGTIRLYWSHVGRDAAYYEVYRSYLPYPQPGVAPANRIDEINGAPYGVGAVIACIDDGSDRYATDGVVPTVTVIGDVQTNYFWVVQARSSTGGVSGIENTVGEFDFALVKGT